jgi:hypothetical protein
MLAANSHSKDLQQTAHQEPQKIEVKGITLFMFQVEIE